MAFEIHPQLLADCHRLGIVESVHVLLHRNALVPWFIVVPETEVADFLDLGVAERHTVSTISAEIGQFVKSHWQLEKTNFAGLGNVVPQLHLHIIGRKSGDACWPNPVWGFLSENKPYTEQEIDQVVIALRKQIRGFE